MQKHTVMVKGYVVQMMIQSLIYPSSIGQLNANKDSIN